MRFFHNAATAARHPTLALDYARWRIGQVIGRPLLVNGVFETRLAASTFADLRSTRGFVPSPSEATMIRSLSPTCPLYIDIGANVGVWTVALAAAHPGAHVYAFEAAPSTYSLLCNNIALNRLQNVTAVPFAVSDANGVLHFQLTEKESIFNRLAPSKESAADLHRDRFADVRTVEVSSIRLDDFCEARQIDTIGFVKIDVEGAEVGVLRGAERLLSRRAIKRIWIEIEPDNLAEMGDSVDDLAALMTDVGYTFHRLQSDGSSGPAVDIRRQHANNMVAMPKQARSL